MQFKTKRYHNLQCPICLSSVEYSNKEYMCSGDRLKVWQKEFKEFENITDKNSKNEFLSKFSNKELFIELYNKKDNLSCGFTYNNVLFSSDSEDTKPDPMVVGKIEKSLNRCLTLEELEEGFTFYKVGNNFSTEEFEGSYEYEIPRIKYPEDV